MGHCKETTIDWINLCRDVCYSSFDNRNKMDGPDEVIQIDKSLLRGRSKYHRGQILLDDQSAENIISDSDSDKENVPNRTKQNYG